MKKKLIVLMTATLFSLGAAIYANNATAFREISEENVEALANDPEDPHNNSNLIERGTYPHRVWIDDSSHVILLEGYEVTEDDKGNEIITEKEGSICRINTSTGIQNFNSIAETVTNILKTLIPILQWLSLIFG